MANQDTKFLYAVHFMDASRANALGKMILSHISKQGDYTFNELWKHWEKLSREDFREMCQRVADSGLADSPRPNLEMLEIAEGIWAGQDLLESQMREQSEAKQS